MTWETKLGNYPKGAIMFFDDVNVEERAMQTLLDCAELYEEGPLWAIFKWNDYFGSYDDILGKPMTSFEEVFFTIAENENFIHGLEY